MSFYTTYWKDRFFQRHLRVNPGQIEKCAVMTRKVRISAEIDIQKNYLLMSDKLDIHSNQTKKNYSIWMETMEVINEIRDDKNADILMLLVLSFAKGIKFGANGNERKIA